MFVLHYQNEYVPDNFNVTKILDQKYRCIRYFADAAENKFLDKRCRNHQDDYVTFKADRMQHIYIYYVYNIIMTFVFLGVHLSF